MKKYPFIFCSPVVENKSIETVKEVVSSTMLGAAELFEDDSFLEFIEKLPMRILEKLTIPEVYDKYLREVKAKKK